MAAIPLAVLPERPAFAALPGVPHGSLPEMLAVLAILLLALAVFAVLLRRAVAVRTRALAESEERYRLLIDNMQGYALYLLDAEGRIASWTAMAKAIWGYTREEVIGHPYAVLFDTDDRAAGIPDHILATARAGGRAEREGWRQRRDGRAIWIHSIVSPIRDGTGTPHGFTVVTHDMSEVRAQQERIMFQATLLNRVRAGIIATDENSRIVYMNAHAEALFQLPWTEAAGRPLTGLGILPDAGKRFPMADAHQEREITAHRQDGTTFPALCISSRIGDTGDSRMEVHVLHDLTDRKSMEQALRHASNLALLGRMSASLVHEISQPMTVIRLTAEGGLLYLRRGCPHALPDSSAVSPDTSSREASPDVSEMTNRLRIISDQTTRLLDTIDLMQIFSRRDIAEATPRDGRFDIAAIARSVAAEVRDRATPSGASITLALPQKAVWTAGRARQIELVLGNLLDNALHAVNDQTTPHSPLIRLGVAPPTAAEPRVRVDVEDSGPGIPPDRWEAIFEPFYTTKAPGHGTGLGLYISLGLVRAMGGALDVGPSPLGGARLTVLLPAANTDTDTPSPSPEPGIRKDDGDTLVLAPDQDAVAEVRPPHLLFVGTAPIQAEIGQGLRKHGFRVSEAASDRAARTALERHNGTANETDGIETSDPAPIDAVIIDIHMPGGAGSDLLHHLDRGYPQIFTLVITDQSPEFPQDTEAPSHADVILRKPISLEVLSTRLNALFGTATDGP